MKDYDVLNFLCDFDIVSLCETWIHSDSQEPFITGYKLFSQYRTRGNAPRRHGGICVFVRNSIEKYFRQLKSESQNILWLLFEPNELPDSQILICSLYHVPANSPYANESILDIVSNEMQSFSFQYGVNLILLLGDLNGRTATEPDFDAPNQYVAGPDIPVPEPRANKDPVYNARGRELLAFCKANGLMIVNGRAGADRGVGNLTCIKYNGSSLVDYLLINENSFGNIIEFEVTPRSESDHFPLTFTISTTDVNKTDAALGQNYIHNENTYSKVRWKADRLDEFQLSLGSEKSQDCIGLVNRAIDDGNLQQAAKSLCDLMWFCCETMISKPPRSNMHDKTIGNQPWYDQECTLSKSKLNKSLKDFRRNRSDDNLKDFLEKKQHLKT